tara:strand:- start:327 stop:707 length:381 start_codon:yes stop_codon:yes gene_type:complete
MIKFMASTQKNPIKSSPKNRELISDQTLGLVSLSLMQKLSQKDPSLGWLIEENNDLKNLKNLRDRLELVDLAIKTGAPISTAEVSFLMGAKPGKSKVERAGLLAIKVSRNTWKIVKNSNENNYWRN